MNNVSALSSLFGDWYWEMDGQLRLTQTSPQFAEKTGLDPADDFWEHNRRSLERHEPFRDFEIQRLAPGGRTVWLLLSGVPVYEQDVFKGYRGVGRDITAQKRGEQLLRLEHAVARALSQATAVAEGLRAGLRAICDFEGWDYGRCFRVEPASGEIGFELGWFAREPSTEQFLTRSRAIWEEGKPVFFKSPREPAGAFATFAFPAVAPWQPPVGRGCSRLPWCGRSPQSPVCR